MAENKLLIGRIPVNKGVYASEKTYNKLSYCSYCGSTYMSLVDGNASAPCIFNEETQRYEHANTDVWQCIADGLDAYNAGNDIQTYLHQQLFLMRTELQLALIQCHSQAMLSLHLLW